MGRPNISPEKAVDLLNEIHALDPTVLMALINYRVPCNAEFADHPTVQVSKIPDEECHDDERPYQVGFLGILNGIFGVAGDGYGYIGAECDEQKKLLLGFRVIR
jgi:hypothetical protein